MKFCPKCGTIMIKKDNKWICKNCGYEEKIKSNDTTRFSEELGNSVEIPVFETETKVLPIDNDKVCPKCGNRGAYYWYMQTRAGDEAETKFYRCVACGYTWREYD